jgi:hypothetical protein
MAPVMDHWLRGPVLVVGKGFTEGEAAMLAREHHTIHRLALEGKQYTTLMAAVNTAKSKGCTRLYFTEMPRVIAAQLNNVLAYLKESVRVVPNLKEKG